MSRMNSFKEKIKKFSLSSGLKRRVNMVSNLNDKLHTKICGIVLIALVCPPAAIYLIYKHKQIFPYGKRAILGIALGILLIPLVFTVNNLCRGEKIYCENAISTNQNISCHVRGTNSNKNTEDDKDLNKEKSQVQQNISQNNSLSENIVEEDTYRHYDEDKTSNESEINIKNRNPDKRNNSVVGRRGTAKKGNIGQQQVHKISKKNQTKVTEESKKQIGNQDEKSTTVYVTKTGKCYHFEKCGKGAYYAISLSNAKSLGLRACKKCY